MPKIIGSSYNFPAKAIPQQIVKETVFEIFEGKIPALEKVLNAFDNSRIAHRHLVMPLDWYRQKIAPAERNRIYQKEGGELLCKAVQKCLTSADLAPDQITHIIFVSSTGLATPTLDTRLIDDLGLPRSTTRIPIWGLGCAAGVSGMARAFDHCLAHPKATVLVAAMECCSLNFLEGDLSRKNLIATALFSDGAAAALIAGDDIPREGPRILVTHSYLFPNSSQIMGWDFRDEGMELLLSPRLPSLVKEGIGKQIEAILEKIGLSRYDLTHYLLHPGGARVIDACREALGLQRGELDLTEEELRCHGNTSSVSILAVLSRWLRNSETHSGYGIVASFGPGFSAELLLIRN